MQYFILRSSNKWLRNILQKKLSNFQKQKLFAHINMKNMNNMKNKYWT